MLYNINVHQTVCKAAGSQCKGLICAWAGGSVSQNLEMLAHVSSDPEICTLLIGQYLNNILIYVPYNLALSILHSFIS